MSGLPVQAKIYILCVTGLGVAVTLSGLIFGHQIPDFCLFAICLVLGVIADLNPITIVEKFTLTVSYFMVAAALVLLPIGWAGLLVALVNAISDILAKKDISRILFNSAQDAVSLSAASLLYYFIYNSMSSFNPVLKTLAPAIPALVVYFVINSFLVSAVIAIANREPLWATFKSGYRWFLVSYIGLTPIGLVMAYLYKACGGRVGEWLPLWLMFAVAILAVHYAIANYVRLKSETISTLKVLADLIDKRDPGTFDHSHRVCEYVKLLTDKLGISAEEKDTIESAARVHDLGKIVVPNEILLKPSKLTDEEFNFIKRHPEVGSRVLGELKLYEKGSLLVKHHHEKFNGTGYPDGLAGDAIPLGARILTVADSFDAMTSDRPYRKGMSNEQAIGELMRMSGIQFDPDVCRAFVEALQENRETVDNLLDSAKSVLAQGENR